MEGVTPHPRKDEILVSWRTSRNDAGWLTDTSYGRLLIDPSDPLDKGNVVWVQPLASPDLEVTKHRGDLTVLHPLERLALDL